ncbi:sporulation protein Cse60 [Bacillus cereus]|nr:hypothetical protein BC059799_B0038 [Bacillus cereus NVH0597-99]MDA2474599.1 sporulation protein Cse60 [Bacillus cereus]
MMKVKVVKSTTAPLLESRINEALIELSDEKIIDIKVVTSGSSSSENYLAVIMYDDGMK